VVRSRAADPLTDVRPQWVGMLDRSSSQGPDWQAYAAGGLDALADLDTAGCGQDVTP
jgi:hypothetical protein